MRIGPRTTTAGAGATLALLLVIQPAWTTSPPAAAQEASPEGRWEGAIQIPGQELGVIVDLARADGVWRGQADIPAQGASDLELSGIAVAGDSVRFALSGIPGEPTFHGVLSAAGDSLTGDFTQGGRTFPFRLGRTGAPELATGPDPQEALEGWGAFVQESMERWSVPGVAMALVADGEVVLSDGWGYRDLEGELPMTERTVMPIGSATKAFTALLVGLLVEEGILDWEEPVRTWLPEFRLEDELAGRRMTPVDLLTHRSGLPRHDLLWYGSPFSREELVRRTRHLDPSEDFRTTFRYNNLMFVTAGYLAGRVTDSSWEEGIRTRIFGPLGMTNSTLSVDSMRAKAPEYALGYRAVDAEEEEETGDDEAGADRGSGRVGSGTSDGATSRTPSPPIGTTLPALGPIPFPRPREEKEIERMEFRRIDAVGPAGSINSSVSDMIRWVRLQLGEGTVDGERVAPAAAVRKAHSPHVVVDEGVFSLLYEQPEMPYTMYGLGWFVQPYRGHRMIHHGGSIDGFSALVSFLPDEDLGLVILANLNGTPLPTVLALSAWDRLLGLEPRDWNARNEEIQGRLEAQREQAAEGGGEAERVEGTRPSHPLEDYAGTYSHPAYGRLRIERVPGEGGGEGSGGGERSGDGEERLQGAYHDFRMGLDHLHYDVFEASFEPPFEDLTMQVQFFLDRKGDVDRLSLPLEASVDPVVFEREPPESMRDPAFLRRFVGDYELMGMTAEVRLREEARTLVVAVPGQPTYTLVPYRGTEFELQGLEGYRVRFETADGEVTELVFIQPNGTFRAERK